MKPRMAAGISRLSAVGNGPNPAPLAGGLTGVVVLGVFTVVMFASFLSYISKKEKKKKSQKRKIKKKRKKSQIKQADYCTLI